MSELSDRLNLLKTHFESVAPTRLITRDFEDYARREQTELEAGVFTIVSQGEADYANYPGRAGALGRHTIKIIGQVVVANNSTPTRADVEDAEFDLLDDVKALVRSDLPVGLDDLQLESFRQSGQLDYPHGWIICDLSYK